MTVTRRHSISTGTPGREVLASLFSQGNNQWMLRVGEERSSLRRRVNSQERPPMSPGSHIFLSSASRSVSMAVIMSGRSPGGISTVPEGFNSSTRGDGQVSFEQRREVLAQLRRDVSRIHFVPDPSVARGGSLKRIPSRLRSPPPTPLGRGDSDGDDDDEDDDHSDDGDDDDDDFATHRGYTPIDAEVIIIDDRDDGAEATDDGEEAEEREEAMEEKEEEEDLSVDPSELPTLRAGDLLTRRQHFQKSNSLQSVPLPSIRTTEDISPSSFTTSLGSSSSSTSLVISDAPSIDTETPTPLSKVTTPNHEQQEASFETFYDAEQVQPPEAADEPRPDDEWWEHEETYVLDPPTPPPSAIVPPSPMPSASSSSVISVGSFGASSLVTSSSAPASSVDEPEERLERLIAPPLSFSLDARRASLVSSDNDSSDSESDDECSPSPDRSSTNLLLIKRPRTATGPLRSILRTKGSYKRRYARHVRFAEEPAVVVEIHKTLYPTPHESRPYPTPNHSTEPVVVLRDFQRPPVLQKLRRLAQDFAPLYYGDMLRLAIGKFSFGDDLPKYVEDFVEWVGKTRFPDPATGEMTKLSWMDRRWLLPVVEQTWGVHIKYFPGIAL